MKKNKLISYLLLLIICIIANIKSVKAGISIGPSPSGYAATCGYDGNCYSLGTGGMRVAIIDSKGNIKGKIVDYWFFNKRGDEFYFPAYDTKYSIPYVYYSTKKLKQDIVKVVKKYGKPITKNIPVGKNDYNITADEQRFTMINFNGLLKKYGFTREFSNGVYIKSNKGLNVRHPNAASTIVKDIIYKNRKNSTGLKYMQQIFTDTKSGYKVGTKVDANLYLQFEPLISWQNMYAPGSSQASITFFGTVTEFARLMYDSHRIKSGCYWSNVDPIAGTYAFTSASCFNPWGIVHSGVIANTQSAIPKNSSGKYIFNAVSKDCDGKAATCYMNNLSYNGYGVGFISLDPYKTEDSCEQLVKNNKISGDNLNKYVANLKKKLGNKWISDYNWLTEKDSNNNFKFVSKYGLTNVGKLKNHLKKSCNRPTCEQAYTYFSDKNKFKNNLFNTTIYDNEASVSNARSSVNNGKAQWNLKIDSKYMTINGNACKATTCSSLLGNTKDKSFENLNSDDKDKVNYLKTLFPSYEYLDLGLLELLGEKPKCDDFGVCDPKVEGGGYCDGKAVFEDSNDWNECLKQGIAYSTTGLATSLDTSLTNSCNSDVYCFEKVTFNLPTTPTQVKAGRILKWGTDNNNNVFGTMKVLRTCWAASCSASTIRPAYWAKNINTRIKLYYKEPVSDTEVSTTLTPELTSIYLNAYNKHVSLNKDNPTYNCGGNCHSALRMGSNFSTEASYKFSYGNDLKWYADKKDNNKLVKYNSKYDKPENLPYYSFIGYGLPTYFTTPTVTHSIKKDSNGYNWEKTETSNLGDGYLYFEIDKIGTKISGGSNHFTELLKAKSNENRYGAFQNNTFRYSCDYSVKNELFGYECVGTDDVPGYCDREQSPKGIDVVFRTIQLIDEKAPVSARANEIKRAFPGRSGTGREIGKNWKSLSTDKILKLLKNTIYDTNDPMYTISLDPSKIAKIRNENKEIRKTTDPYTYISSKRIGSVTNSGYKCTKKTGDKYSYCISTFVHNMMHGKCVDNRKNNVSLLQKPCE